MYLKKKIKKILFLVPILLVIVITLIVGKSYSKYIDQVQGKGIIKVADWSFTVNGETAKITDINLAQTYKADTLSQNTIAPGTQGAFNIVIDASGSDTGIEYTVKFENETDKPSNLKFIYEDNTVNSIKELETFLSGKILASDMQKVKVMTIEWVWKYETGNSAEEIKNNDKTDTEEGKKLENYKFDVKVEGMQIIPEI